MHGDLDHPPIVVSSKRWHWRLLFLVPALVYPAIFAAPLVQQPSHAGVWAYVSAAVFVLLAVLFALVLVFPLRIEIGPGGVATRYSWRRRELAWTEARDFRPVTYVRGRVIGYDFTGPRAARAGRSSVAGLTGADGLLVATRTLNVDEETLCELLNRARARWVPTDLEEAARHAPPIKPAFRAYLVAVLVGRIGRRLYASVLATGLVLAVVVGWVSGNWTFSAVAVWIVASLPVGSRMRDLGWSPRWRAVPLLLVIPVAGIAAVSGNLWVALAAGAVIPLAFLAYLGFAPGSPGPNRYGLRPGQHAEIAARTAEAFD